MAAALARWIPSSSPSLCSAPSVSASPVAWRLTPLFPRACAFSISSGWVVQQKVTVGVASAALEDAPSSSENTAVPFDGVPDAEGSVSSNSGPGRVLSSSPSSLVLSQDFIERVLAGDEPVVKIDHYSRLKIPRKASDIQISNAFKERVQEVLEQQGINENSARKQLKLFQESYDILMSVPQRRIYDWSLMRSEQRSTRYVWPYEADVSARGPPPMISEVDDDVEGTRNLSYFFLGWFILSIILSLTLHP